jgi:hypothetical protein
MSEAHYHPASFRDPSGFIFRLNGKIYRQVNKSFAEDYDSLMSSGLYSELVKKEWLVSHNESGEVVIDKDRCYKTLVPEQLAFISYPYEWCFEQLRDAALLTLSILRTAIGHGMILKDATPYNIQFRYGRPIFIDTLSFERYDESKTWVAYRQFCELFLFPLYLKHYTKTDIQKILSVYLDGIPANITARLLPLRSRFNFGVRLHVHLQKAISGNKTIKREENFSKTKLLHLVGHLESIISSLDSKGSRAGWSNYYNETILGKEYLTEKEKIFKEFIEPLNVASALDIGANDGYFSKILATKQTQVIAIDDDSRSISKLYNGVKSSATKNILPLIIDIANPSPAIGFNNKERSSFHERIKTELVVALAVIHHLVIGKNITLEMLAGYFGDICSKLIIEWVPREDEKVEQMLASRKDVFGEYTEDVFIKQFTKHFNIDKKAAIPGTKRVLYFLLKK